MKESEKIEFYQEVVEKSIKWSGDWKRYNEDETNPKPKDSKEFAKELMVFKKHFKIYGAKGGSFCSNTC